jgi:hypothetical protein
MCIRFQQVDWNVKQIMMLDSLYILNMFASVDRIFFNFIFLLKYWSSCIYLMWKVIIYLWLFSVLAITTVWINIKYSLSDIYRAFSVFFDEIMAKAAPSPGIMRYFWPCLSRGFAYPDYCLKISLFGDLLIPLSFFWISSTTNMPQIWALKRKTIVFQGIRRHYTSNILNSERSVVLCKADEVVGENAWHHHLPFWDNLRPTIVPDYTMAQQIRLLNTLEKPGNKLFVWTFFLYFTRVRKVLILNIQLWKLSGAISKIS